MRSPVQRQIAASPITTRPHESGLRRVAGDSSRRVSTRRVTAAAATTCLKEAATGGRRSDGKRPPLFRRRLYSKKLGLSNETRGLPSPSTIVPPPPPPLPSRFCASSVCSASLSALAESRSHVTRTTSVVVVVVRRASRQRDTPSRRTSAEELQHRPALPAGAVPRSSGDRHSFLPALCWRSRARGQPRGGGRKSFGFKIASAFPAVRVSGGGAAALCVGGWECTGFLHAPKTEIVARTRPARSASSSAFVPSRVAGLADGTPLPPPKRCTFSPTKTERSYRARGSTLSSLRRLAGAASSSLRGTRAVEVTSFCCHSRPNTWCWFWCRRPSYVVLHESADAPGPERGHRCGSE